LLPFKGQSGQIGGKLSVIALLAGSLRSTTVGLSEAGILTGGQHLWIADMICRPIATDDDSRCGHGTRFWSEILKRMANATRYLTVQEFSGEIHHI